MAEQKNRVTKVKELRPMNSDLNLTVKVISAKAVEQRGRTQGRFSECLIGDETVIIIFTARNDQVDLAKEGNTLVLSNTKVDLFKGSMRLAVDRFGSIKVGDPVSFSVTESNNSDSSL